jgi:hypothetical protein
MCMRTTLDIDEDVLQAAKELAQQQNSTAGRVLSELARKGLQPPAESRQLRNGVPLLGPRQGEKPVTSEVVENLRDEG